MGEEFKEMTSFMRKTACRAEATRRRIYRAAAWRRRKQGISENEALDKGLKEKSAEFVQKGAEVYAKT